MEKIASLPYDKEITYLESSGTQYIDTGLTGGTNAEYEIRCQVLNTSDNWDILFGSKANSSVSAQGVPKLYYHSTNGGRVGATTIWKGSAQNIQLLLNTVYNINTLSFKGGGLYVDDTLKYDLQAQYGFGNKNFWIFADPEETNYKINMRLYYAKIWLEGTLVRDFIPVRVGQVGYLYDKVNGVLYGNSGTGNFILGE